MSKQKDITTIRITMETWRKVNRLRESSDESPNDVVFKAIVLLEQQRKDVS